MHEELQEGSRREASLPWTAVSHTSDPLNTTNTVPCVSSLLSACRPREDRREEHLGSCQLSSPHTSENERPVRPSKHAGSAARPWHLAKMRQEQKALPSGDGETERSRVTKTHTCAGWGHDCVWRRGLQGGDEGGMRSRGTGVLTRRGGDSRAVVCAHTGDTARVAAVGTSSQISSPGP